MNYRPRKVEIILTETKRIEALEAQLAAAEERLQKYKYDLRMLELKYGGVAMREGRLLDYICTIVNRVDKRN